jgi:glycosyltransferase involved in cell wall biosynthesis
MDAPVVSVVISAYQAESFLARTLDSALAQTVRDIEVIAVDNGSADGTSAVIAAAAARDPRVRPLRLELNRGPSGGRNAGLKVARGEFVAPLDADDLWRPDKLEQQLRRFAAAGPQVGVVYSWWTYVDEAGCILPGRGGSPCHEGDVYARLLMASFVGPSSVPLVRRPLLEQVGGYDEALLAHEDKALYLALAERCDFAVMPQCLVGYTARPGSLSHDLDALERCDRAVHAEARRRHPELPDWLFNQADANFTWWRAFRHLRAGERGKAVAAGLRVLALDPGFMLRSTALNIPRSVIARLTGRRRAAGPPGPPFLAGPTPRLELVPDANAFDRWRDARLGRLRIARNPMPQPAPVFGEAERPRNVEALV